MNRGEQIPLLRTASASSNSFYNKLQQEELEKESSNNSFYQNDAYLLLSVPPYKDKSCIRLFQNIGSYCGVITAVNLIIIIFVAIIWITIQADTTVFANYGESSSTNLQLLAQEESKVITTPLGKVKGYIRKSRAGRKFIAYYKVPYAKPPLEDLRFKDPQPVEGWNGILDNKKVAPHCIKKDVKTEKATGEEDCLYANIYVPDSDFQYTNYPTMVYIHGGGFSQGNASKYGAEYFMDEDVVLITFQWRLGLLGFLNTGEDREATGNMGLKDQVEMLKWAKSNIKSYGGDPNRIAIFGNSLGGFAVSFHMLSPMSKGLFNFAISQSGTTFCETLTTTIDTLPEATKYAAAKTFNCSSESSADILNCLRKQNASDLALFMAPPETKYGLTVEKGFNPDDLSNVFMPDQPYYLLQSGKVNPAAYMIGVTSTEYISASLGLLKSNDATAAINANFSGFIQESLQLQLSEDEVQSYKSFYFGDKTIGNHTERNLTNLLSDWVFIHCSKATADMFSKQTETFLYYLSKHPKKSYAEKYLDQFPFIDKEETCAHADEVQFLFPYNGYPEYPVTDKKYYPFSRYMVKLWAHFAKTGNPVMEPGMEVWKPVSKKEALWYELNDHTGLTTVLNERMAFWDKFSHKQLNYLVDM